MPEVNERRPQAVQCLIEGMCSIHLKNSTRLWLQDHKRVREVRGLEQYQMLSNQYFQGPAWEVPGHRCIATMKRSTTAITMYNPPLLIL